MIFTSLFEMSCANVKIEVDLHPKPSPVRCPVCESMTSEPYLVKTSMGVVNKDLCSKKCASEWVKDNYDRIGTDDSA